jgi:hypothetical protein
MFKPLYWTQNIRSPGHWLGLFHLRRRQGHNPFRKNNLPLTVLE